MTTRVVVVAQLVASLLVFALVLAPLELAVRLRQLVAS